jgi:hypothetical protein
MPETTATSAEATEPKPTEAAEAAEPKKKFDPENPDPNIIRACRSLTTRGIPCRQRAVKGQDFCVRHFERNKINLSISDQVAVPLLEDDSAIQLMLTKILSGLLNGQIQGSIASKAIYCCQVANSTLARAERKKSGDKPAPVEEPVVELHFDYAGNLVGPREEYRGPTGTFEPQWSFAKYLYEQQCEQAGKPKPTCAADYPESGWLTEEEIKEGPDVFNERLNARSLEQMEKDEAARKNNPCPPEPVDGPEWTEEDMEFMLERCWCGGMEKGNPCDYCLHRHKRYQAHLWKQKQNSVAQQQPTDQTNNENTDNEEGTVDLNAAAERRDVVEVVNIANNMIPKARKKAQQGGTPSRRLKCTRTTPPQPLPLLSLDESKTRYFASAVPSLSGVRPRALTWGVGWAWSLAASWVRMASPMDWVPVRLGVSGLVVWARAGNEARSEAREMDSRGRSMGGL